MTTTLMRTRDRIDAGDTHIVTQIVKRKTGPKPRTNLIKCRCTRCGHWTEGEIHNRRRPTLCDHKGCGGIVAPVCFACGKNGV